MTAELEEGDRQRAMKRLRVPPLGAAQVRNQSSQSAGLQPHVKQPPANQQADSHMSNSHQPISRLIATCQTATSQSTG